MRRLRRRFGRAKAGTGKVRAYDAWAGAHGPSIRAYDARGRVVNVINGSWSKGDTIDSVRREARKHWPDARDKTP